MPAPAGAMANDINTVGFSGPLPDERTVRVDPHRVTIGGGATFGDVQVPLIWGLELRGLSGHIRFAMCTSGGRAVAIDVRRGSVSTGGDCVPFSAEIHRACSGEEES